MRSSRLLFVTAFALPAVIQAQATPARPATAATPAAPAPTVRAEALKEVDYFERRYVSLAEATPAEKFTYRPAEGVRSVAEVFLHVAGANYMLPQMMGAKAPATFSGQGFETSTTDKAKIVAELRSSFAHLRSSINSASDADNEKMLKVFGQDMTQRAFLSFMNRHLGEHLGQSIAYARHNGVKPPWAQGG